MRRFAAYPIVERRGWNAYGRQASILTAAADRPGYSQSIDSATPEFHAILELGARRTVARGILLGTVLHLPLVAARRFSCNVLVDGSRRPPPTAPQ
jgi:hypothetical protein